MKRRPEVARVRLDERAWNAYGLSGSMPVGSIIVLPGGTVVKVLAGGTLDELRPGGHPKPGIAADAFATRRPV